jgi:8-oxo-dGTP pyrophosphatase MutT (NUDIX family)
MQVAKVVTCFLLRRTSAGDEVLLLRRSQQVGTYRGRWAGVSGYLEEADPLAQAYREVEEEAGLTRADVSLLQAGEPIGVLDAEAGRRWIVHPFLFEVRPDAEVLVDWEHTEARWVPPEEVFAFETVPQLAEALARVYPLDRP